MRPPRPGARKVTAQDLLTGFSFALTGEIGDNGFGALWGRVALSRFDGHEGELSLDGEVQSILLGTDWAQGRATMGLALSHSNGEGDYRSELDDGTIRTTLTGLYPYGRYEISKRLSVWGTVGYGSGEFKLTPKVGARIETDMDMKMAAVGGRGLLAKPSEEGGLELAATSDAMVVRTESDSQHESSGTLMASEADVTRLRFGFKGTWHGIETGSSAFEPGFEVGVRHDGGDAETGFGVDIGAGIAWRDPERGIQAEVRARGLLTHEDSDFQERGFSGSFAWDPNPASDRGLALTLSQTIGASATGGVEALLRPDTAQGLGVANDDALRRRLEAKLSYGMPVLGRRYTGTPEVGFGLSEADREIRLGWLLEGPVARNLGFNIRAEGSRLDARNEDREPEHKIGIRMQAHW